ncbi:hypothetical protein LSUE1_G006158 [Lachnellula suecica]|uniref:Uncharacterized protein n=1 Tax=Lachnellula suecica TaxID=602035 RepID=A0A8T9BXZ2_9HELO|nr:hypothetical protein LSUE1_G006158 [Lachnellula suecica]
MAVILLPLITILLASLASLVHAIPSVKAIQVGAGNCSAFPSTFVGAGDNADGFVFSPDQADDSSINGLTTGITGSTLVVYKNSTDVLETIFCCDFGGTILDGFGIRSLLLPPTISNDTQLAYMSEGIKPQTYVHEVNGTRQAGTFLGWANVTTWAFKTATWNPDFWQMRLLVSESGDSKGASLSEGEFMGFLKVQLP